MLSFARGRSEEASIKQKFASKISCFFFGTCKGSIFGVKPLSISAFRMEFGWCNINWFLIIVTQIKLIGLLLVVQSLHYIFRLSRLG